MHLLEDHLLLYSNPEMRKVFAFAIDTVHCRSYPQLDLSYQYQGEFLEVVKDLEKELTRISEKVYRATTYNPNLFVAGFVNVKYIAPGMLTMTFGHQNRRVVSRRVEKAIQFKKRGTFDKVWIEETPHPFP